MDVKGILAQLQRERDALDAAIATLEKWERERRSSPVHSLNLLVKSPSNGASHDYAPPDSTPDES